MSTRPSAQLAALAVIAHEAGAIVMRHYVAGVEARKKQDSSPVTAADEDAERYILERLLTLSPEIPVVAEESVAGGRTPKVGSHFFLVDPLDGTKEFINRNGEFTVNIAEIAGGIAIRGVVYAPAKQRLFLGEAGAGAWEIDIAAGQTLDLAKARSIHVRKAPGDGLIAVASRSHRDKKTEEYLAHYPVKDFVTSGSSLKFCLVATGEADIYPRHGTTMEWDTAAGHAVLSAAGGTVTNLDGSPFLYGRVNDNFTNPHFVARGAT
ncbi:MAG: 3'(2'),5'-bisphosphate nucleotidase CysQ [Alphaproteobacteria bacterium]|nr:3'(2'),5'-bisphosphate nucleotidase CysQ [Alphaproteobacteria bacterium]MBL6937327.1 3'(2'),5'-bisphosphate nucleotidase CysQ [Alphaproteobacteria bacterium]MBL7096111.1 3'(2'),5'-bisphosphate nucleotidase CysQ [Alphaproteobacteria bacterium]